MCMRAVAMSAAGFVLAAPGLLAGPAQAQSDSARPAVQDVASKPIGKIVVATGTVTLERAGAVVVQASTAGQAAEAKVGDVVRIVETRPLSKLKNWRLAEIVEAAK